MPIIKKATRQTNPARTLALGFMGIILIGAVVLCLPISSNSGEYTSFFDCLFTATSATCVTGLIIYDTFSHWNIFGQILIALLIQVGGLGFVTIITFFNIAAGKKLGFRTLAEVSDGLTESSFEGGRRIIVSIIKYSVIFELVGALLLMMKFIPEYGAYGIWMGLFLSITAFCNAGFDLCGINTPFSSLTAYQDDPLVLIVIAMLIMIGGLGFIVWENFLNLHKTKKLSLHTKCVLLMTGILVVGGTIFYLFTEWSNPQTLGSMSFGEKLLNAFFSSVSARTAGYNSISIEGMSEFSQFGTIFLMFIGAAPASTGGGIKITTLLVIVMTVVSYIMNKNDVEIFSYKINKLAIYRTLVISVLSICAVMLCFTALYFTLPENSSVGAVQCLFEAVSAFSTTGLSVGVTAIVGTVGKIVLIVAMYIGRVGPISLIMSLMLDTAKRKNIVVPDGQIIIG